MEDIDLAAMTAALPLPDDLCRVTRNARRGAAWNGRRIRLGGRSWNLFPEEAAETYISPANNDAGLVRSPFLLEGLRGAVIDGGGARMAVRGTPLAGRGRTTVIDPPLVPFVIRDCEDVTIRNLSLDWTTPGTVQGRCIARSADGFDVELATSQRCWAWNGQLYVEGEGWTWPVRRLLAVDSATGAVLPGTGDNLGVGYDANWIYRMLDDRVVRIGGFPAAPPVGSTVLFWCTNHDTGARRAPAIFIENSARITLEDVTLHYTWGMGVIAQASRDLAFSRIVVEPGPGRLFSLAADAIHAVSCRGAIAIDGCRMQNQFDDAVNIHGVYHQAVRSLGPRGLRVRTCHPQHQGLATLRPGDRLRICRNPRMTTAGEAVLAGLERLNSETTDLRFDADLPAGIAGGDLVENISAHPDVSITGCTFRWNRARGILLNGGGRIRVEGNAFENPGAAILVESAPEWGESGPLADLSIVGNRFTSCATCPPWGKAVIQILPDFRREEDHGLPPFHDRVTVRGNTFAGNGAPPLRTRSVRSLDSDLPG